ncbi:prepilin-type N-terminal cleavage/methylation domain-containing protein [Puniceicoccaceae bacterium]|nr:prepilin-type N-terminal cleavage/methylation domain-containing protein [Puniceicoccaceae bacterium]
MHSPHYIRSKGFTLTELIVAMGIFTMVIAGGLSGVSRGFDILGDSRNFTRVSQILQSEIESLRSLSWQELTDLPENAEISLDTQFDTSAYNLYGVSREIISVEDEIRQVNVIVSHENGRGRLITLKYITFFSKGGLNDYYYRVL